MILVVHAHPYPSRSRGCAALLAGLAGLPQLEVRSLYALYPDFDIDAGAEQAALTRASFVVWLHPLYWYTTPALMKHWFDQVLHGDFIGSGALRDKPCLWAVTTGGGEYAPGGAHEYPFDAFARPLEMTARYCGMRWLEPFVVHDASGVGAAELERRGTQLRERLAGVA
jgi:glutathione-regulated potassium-efflux system ancillary protein KefF